MASGSFAVVDWRRRTAPLYAQIRAEPDPREAHAIWCATRADAAKGADLGGNGRPLVPDLNFAYNRSSMRGHSGQALPGPPNGRAGLETPGDPVASPGLRPHPA